jgi:hypothetical protein
MADNHATPAGVPLPPPDFYHHSEIHHQAAFARTFIANLQLIVQSLWVAFTTLGDTVGMCYGAIQGMDFASAFPPNLANHSSIPGQFPRPFPSNSTPGLPNDIPQPTPPPQPTPAMPAANNTPPPTAVPDPPAPAPVPAPAAPAPTAPGPTAPGPAPEEPAPPTPAPAPFDLRDPTPEEIAQGGYVPQTGSTRFYVVTCGTSVGIFSDWYALISTSIILFLNSLCRLATSPRVTGVPCAIYKKYNSRFDAVQAYRWAVDNGQIKIVNMG